MKPISVFTIALAAVLLSSSNANSQVTLQAGVGAGAVFPTSDFAGTTLDYYSGSNYGFSTGFNFHGKGRVGFGGFTLVGEIGYSSVSNSGDAEPGQGKVEISQKIISVKVGPEYHIDLPAVPIKPYLGANVALNLFSGETKFQGVSRVSSGTYSVRSTSRIGFGFTGGAVVSMGLFTSLDVALHYNLLNATGKSFEDVDPTQDQRLDSYLALNDAADPQYAPNNPDHFVGSSRSLNTIMLTVSLMFGL